jgi:hypothetical protein
MPWSLKGLGVNETQTGGASKQVNLTMGRSSGGCAILIIWSVNETGDLMGWKQVNLMSVQGGSWPSYLDIKEQKADQELKD